MKENDGRIALGRRRGRTEDDGGFWVAAEDGEFGKSVTRGTNRSQIGILEELKEWIRD